MGLIILPAIDLRGGSVVRLRQGDPAAQTLFDLDPAAVARRWAEEGAPWLHVVNLDGALSGGRQEGRGHPARTLCIDDMAGAVSLNLRRLAEIRAATHVPLQFGGGIRSLADIELVLSLGANRVLLGTVAIRHPDLVGLAVQRFGPQRIVVALDARNGRISTDGWQEQSQLSTVEVALQMAHLGVVRVLHTDIARDGMLAGVNVDSTVELAQTSGLRVIASGGVAGLADIRSLAARYGDGIEGVVVGQALYTGALDLKSALEAASA